MSMIFRGSRALVASVSSPRRGEADRAFVATLEFQNGAVTKAFYDEYFAVLDLTAEFYLETVRLIFQVPAGTLEWRGDRVEPRAIKRAPCCVS